MDDAPTFDFIYAHIKNLRKKLIEASVGDYLKTVYGVGYQFVIP
jgi:DNA-binding response OmpR family regulator